MGSLYTVQKSLNWSRNRIQKWGGWSNFKWSGSSIFGAKWRLFVDIKRKINGS